MFNLQISPCFELADVWLIFDEIYILLELLFVFLFLAHPNLS